MNLRMLNLAPRSALCFGFFCVLIVCLGLFSARQASILSEAEKKVEGNIVPSFKVLGLLDREFMSLRNSNSKLRNAGESEAAKSKSLSDIKQSTKLIDEHLADLAGLVITAGGEVVLDSLKISVDQFKNKQQQYLELVANEDFETAIRFNDDSLRMTTDSVTSDIEKLKESNDLKAKAAGDSADEAYSQTLAMVGFFIVMSLLAMVLLAWMYTRSLILPMRQSLSIAERIAANDFSQNIKTDGHDEMGRLIAALSVMQNNLRSAIVKISDSSTQLAATSEEMHAVTEDASKGLIRQNSEIEMAATAVNQMSSAVDEVASNAAGASTAAAQASKTAVEGRSKVDETVSAINLMVSNVETTSESVRGLAAMATDISKVLDVIRSIAQQTNLLALNAAIEAARAGDAGRGFAVVADEVRALAHRTQESTTEIEKMISTIQTSSNAAVTSMDQTSLQAGKTLALARSAGLALVEITESIGHINDRNVQIATAAEEQSQVARQVDISLVSIRDLSTQSAAGSNQTSVASGELSKLAVDLNHLVARFKV
jgi:methyl-accepting chemotaxis protein